MHKKFLKNITNLIQPNSKILVAVSGGIDSVVLLHLLAEFFKENLQHLAVIHCNFQLREEDSNDDENFVENLANQLKVKIYSRKFDTKNFQKEQKLSTQEAARVLRYEYFEEVRQKQGYDYIAVAHHSDDQIETFFINLLRGTGYKGLRGMLPLRNHILRPLLKFSREEITAFAEKNDIQFHEDYTNAQTKYKRNKIRHKVIPLLEEISPSAKKAILTTMDNLASLDADANPKVEYLLNHNFTSAQIRQILECNRTGAEFQSKTHRLIINRGDFIIEKNQEENKKNLNIENQIKIDIQKLKITEIDDLHQVKNIALIDEDKIFGNLTIRKAEEGDKFMPFGMRTRKKLSRFFIDEKMSKFEKEKQFVVCDDRNIVWIIGRRIDQRYAVDEKTQNILKLVYFI